MLKYLARMESLLLPPTFCAPLLHVLKEVSAHNGGLCMVARSVQDLYPLRR